MEAIKNNTGYVEYIMDYLKVLVPLFPFPVSSLSPLDTKIKLFLPKNPPWTLSCAYKTIQDQIVLLINTFWQELHCSRLISS